MATLTDYGLVSVEDAPPELARAARGIPLRAMDRKTIRAFAVVEADDYDEIAAHRWHLHPLGYAARREGPVGQQTTILMHRQLMGLARGDQRQVDHRNRVRLDNRRCNLRIVPSQAAQLQNVPSRGGSSRFRGVRLYAPTGRWQARAQLDRKQYHLGYFKTEQEAAEAAAAFRRQRMPFSND